MAGFQFWKCIGLNSGDEKHNHTSQTTKKVREQNERVLNPVCGKLPQDAFHPNKGGNRETGRQEERQMKDPYPKRGKGEFQEDSEREPRETCVPGCWATSPGWRSEVPRQGGSFLRVI